MNYKDLFEKYKAGTASPDEKRLVEEELAKFNAIEDYLSESLDDSISPVFESDYDKQKAETLAISKVVNRRLRRIIFVTVAILAGLYFLSTYLVANVVDMFYYDPTSRSMQVEKDHYENIFTDLEAFIGLNHPESVLGFTLVDSKGFGNYDIAYTMKDRLTGESQIHNFSLSRNRIIGGGDGIFDHRQRDAQQYGFQSVTDNWGSDEETAKYHQSQKERESYLTKNLLQGLGPKNYVSLSLVFETDQSMEEVFQLMEDNPKVDFHWIGIRTIDSKDIPEMSFSPVIGFSPDNQNGRIESGLDETKYPGFYYQSALYNSEKKPDEFVIRQADAANIHFKTRLQYLIDRPKFFDMLLFSELDHQFFTNALDYVEKNGMYSLGVMVHGMVEDVLEFIDNTPYRNISYNRVLAAPPPLTLFNMDPMLEIPSE